MPEIRVLPSHVADLIAAGEVVERPASAAKELIENAIDAGASAVTVEIKRGGSDMLRVADDGCGMSPDDARSAFLRHATSKIRDEQDLRAVKTLGFRGEALAALAAVSRVDLLTRQTGALYGTVLTLEAGEPINCSEAGCPVGTTIVARDLFFNVPARQKFLKKDHTEALQVQGAVARAAQSRPDIAFVYINEGREVLRTPGTGKLEDCLHSLWGRDVSAMLAPASGAHMGCELSGFIGRPELTRGNRDYEHFFVNRRPVRSRAVSAALEQAFKHSAGPGRYPVCSLHISAPEDSYDVNVHPSKLEIKFADEKTLFELVYAAVRDALLDNPKRPNWDAPAPFAPPPAPPAPPVVNCSLLTVNSPPPAASPSYAETRLGMARLESPAASLSAAAQLITPVTDAPVFPLPAPAPVLDIGGDYRYIGEALGGYLIAESGDELVLIDKHAAHERMIYDRLKAVDGPPMSQELIAPAVVTLSPGDCAALSEHAQMLEGAGLRAEGFGDGSVAVRALPDGVDVSDAALLLSELAGLLRKQGRLTEDQRRDAALELIACKAAVKVGRRFSELEAMEVARWVMRDKSVWHCPHGRPVAVALTRADLHKRFLR